MAHGPENRAPVIPVMVRFLHPPPTPNREAIMIWARYRFLKITGPQKWRWDHFPDTASKSGIDEHYKEMCSDEAAMYERGAKIEWEIGEIPPRSVLTTEANRLEAEATKLNKQAAEIRRKIKSGRGIMTEERLEKLNKGAR